MNAKDRIIVALDVGNLAEAMRLVKSLSPYVGCFKIGLQLIISAGAPQVVNLVHNLGGKVFLDGKFDDISNTVGEAAKAAAELKVAIFNVHASAGIDSMRAAVQNKGDSKVLAVTVLTSLDDKSSEHIFGAPSKQKVLQFAFDAKEAGIDGIVCSPQELEMLSKHSELDSLSRVTPGVRPEWASANDQKRVMTPGEAILAGATALVIGRPITKPPKEVGDPTFAARRIASEIEAALKRRKQ